MEHTYDPILKGRFYSDISTYGETIGAILEDESIKLAQKEIDDTPATNIRYVRPDITIVDYMKLS